MTERKGSHNITIGSIGEEHAIGYLRRGGYEIIERNFRAPCGEVDIIARDGGTLVFVEVKTRRSMVFGPPQLAVTPFKQRQIAKASLVWLARNRMENRAARFDVISVLLQGTYGAEIEHIPNAFELVY